ncbi:prolipoprotein diacylglyceryl transferase [Actinomyces trachealis]|uniref:prolipoprotein diacylglyceryl transferase n=1 Tax=Actinomyces trachealis TaxID=2763540 RepID=UPI0018C83340|nr:prolipoprotein diacylglyceryl transferase [Actinomyces trachealis]
MSLIASPPGLCLATQIGASLPSPSQGVWHLGPIPLRAYSFCLLAGIFLAVGWGERRYQAAGGQRDMVVDLALVSVPLGIVGARIYHVLTSPDAYFGPEGSLANIPRVWEGGIGIWGGIAAGAATCAVLLRRRGLRAAPFADALAPGVLAGQAVGRFGNWFNQELFGGPTTLPWGLEIDDTHLPDGYASGTLFHPTFLYESIWNAGGVLVLLWLARRLKIRDGATGGRLMWAYMMVYTAGRVWIEMLRVDDAQLIAGLRLNVWTSLLVFLAGLAGFIWTSRRGPSDALQRAGSDIGSGSPEGTDAVAGPAGDPDADETAATE